MISSISGCIMLVIPEVGGLAIYSPLLNEDDVSSKALSFCHSFISKFPPSK